MKAAKNQALRTLSMIVIPAYFIASLALIISLAVPSESREGELSKSLVSENAVPKEFALKIKDAPLVHIRAKVMNLAVKMDGDQYTCIAALSVINTDEVGSQRVIATIQPPRVQRVFELAMALKNYNEPVLYQRGAVVEAWGYKNPVPEGKELMDAAFYTIAEAKIWDDELCDVVLQPWMHPMY
jgi:hypothetical protein